MPSTWIGNHKHVKLTLNNEFDMLVRPFGIHQWIKQRSHLSYDTIVYQNSIDNNKHHTSKLPNTLEVDKCIEECKGKQVKGKNGGELQL